MQERVLLGLVADLEDVAVKAAYHLFKLLRVAVLERTFLEEVQQLRAARRQVVAAQDLLVGIQSCLGVQRCGQQAAEDYAEPAKVDHDEFSIDAEAIAVAGGLSPLIVNYVAGNI